MYIVTGQVPCNLRHLFSVLSLHVTPAWKKDMVLRIEAFSGGTLVGSFEETLGHPITDYSLSDPSSSFISLEEFSKNNPTQDFADITVSH